jgi:hypothetical protein
MDLLCTSLVWVRRGRVVLPLQRPYNGPFLVLCCGPRSFIIRVGNWEEIVSASRLKLFTDDMAQPGVPRLWGFTQYW